MLSWFEATLRIPKEPGRFSGTNRVTNYLTRCYVHDHYKCNGISNKRSLARWNAKRLNRKR